MFRFLILVAMTLLAQPRVYTALRATSPIVIDGRAHEAAWKNAPWTDDFIDIEGDLKPKPRFRTRAKLLWDDQNLYVFAELQEPHVWGTLRDRNSIIYHDNDFEIFIDPDGDRLKYYEFEMNALNTIMELSLDKPYIDGGNYAFIRSPNIRSAVHVDGTLNDPRDEDRAWSVEVAILFKELSARTVGVRLPSPKVGDEWRVNFSRVQWMHRIVDGKYQVVPKSEHNEDNWVWSPMGVIDMHRPDRWGRLRFGK